jgi:hypothetical protein
VLGKVVGLLDGRRVGAALGDTTDASNRIIVFRLEWHNAVSWSLATHHWAFALAGLWVTGLALVSADGTQHDDRGMGTQCWT